MIWYALLIPILISFLGWFIYRRKITWRELFLAPILSALFIVISFYSMKSFTLKDVEYNGFLVTEARYYEPYTTWKKKTCSYTTCSGSGKTRTCVTHYYDCSYCDENPEEFTMLDTGGNELNISKQKYKSLVKQWSATPEFLELNRDINYNGSCGDDGDAYSIQWDQKRFTSETTTYEKEFSNILKSNHSAFNYPVIEPEKAQKSGLYEYPKFQENSFQTSVLGIEKVGFKQKEKFKKYLDYLNGAYGKQYKIRIYTLFFKEKDISAAFLQEAYWDGGNQNEIVVCVGLDSKSNVTWVKPFSWCDNKRVSIEIREELMSSKKIEPELFYNTYYNVMRKFWKYKSFKDFNYLSFEPTSGQLWFVFIITIVISLLIMRWCITNEEDND